MDRRSAYSPFYITESSTAHPKAKDNASDPPPGSIFIEHRADSVGTFGGGRRKRNEAERIAYLSQDAYVAQLEPHRVLCRGCSKWIRLRANTTYCTSPWTLHKVSCFPKNGLRGPDERAAKRPRLETPPVETLSPELESDDERDELANENRYIQRDSQLTFAERVAIFAQDSAVEEFNEDGLKCSGCKGWLEFPVQAQGNHRAVVAFWHDHRDKCMAVVKKERVLERVVAAFPTSPSTQLTPVPNAGTTHSAPSSSARRKNEEQRIAVLQADTLILTIEPHRVRCALCDKWIALRKDSSYCAYPWLQHRGKCVIRYQKKQGEDAGAAADGMEPEVVGNTRATPSAASTSQTRPTYNHTHPHPPRSLPVESEYPPTPFTTMAMVTAQPRVLLHNAAMPSVPEPRRPPAHPVSDLTIAPVHPFMTPISDMTRPAVSGPKRKAARAPPTLPRPNLNSNSGRASFIASSITHLFRTTHAPTDALSISALVAYVNAAVPPDRYEDFDTEEVARGAGAFCAAPETGFVMEGDLIRSAGAERV